jgi:hypothetical protein
VAINYSPKALKPLKAINYSPEAAQGNQPKPQRPEALRTDVQRDDEHGARRVGDHVRVRQNGALGHPRGA